jgi:Rad3-related DNA helicase
MNYVYSKLGPVAPFKPRDVIICDEAHKIPDIVESHFACKLDINIVSKINFGIEALNQIGRKKYRPIDTLPLFQAISFAISCEVDCPPQQHYSALKSVYATMSAVNKQLGAIKTEVVSQYIPEGYSAEDLVKWSGLLPKAVKQFMKLCDAVKDHHCKVEDYTNMIEKHGLDYMVADNEEGDRVYHNMSDFHLFHKHFRKFAKTRIYMSATLQPQLLIERWQLNPEQCQVINVHSDWDHRRSPIVFCDKNINLGYKGGASAIAKAVQSIDNILDGHASHRGIIHTTTHAIAAQLLSSSRHQSRLYTYQTTAEKCELLDKIDELPKDAVLVGPSLYTGIDCTDDRARFNIIVKLAFPNVASRLWATRFDQCKDVYFGETASVLEQSAGRTSRHKDDYSITYIIDSRAADFVKYSGKYLSSTFLSRLVY